jgi:hypothetical protein
MFGTGQVVYHRVVYGLKAWLALALIAGAVGIAPGAAAQDADAGEPVSFADILAKPDDVDLNFRYARQQVAAGNLTAASASLERMLIHNPELHEVRLFYAVLLYRLDNYLEAEVEFRRIPVDALPARLQPEVERYLGLIERRKRPTRYFGSVGVGFEYDTNVNSISDTGTVLIFDLPFAVGDEEDDFGFLGRATLGFEHELETQDQIDLIGDVTVFANEQADAGSQSHQYFAGRFGAVIRTGPADITPLAQAGALRLSNEHFYTFGGISLSATHRIDAKLLGNAAMRWRYEDFDGIREDAFAHERTGHRFELGAGLSYAHTASQILAVSLNFIRKTAEMEYEMYKGARVDAALTVGLFKDHFAQASVSAGMRDYDALEPIISLTQVRSDKFVRLRASYGVPLSSFLGDAGGDGALLSDISIVPSVEYYKQTSNLPNYEYDNFKVALMITKGFEF